MYQKYDSISGVTIGTSSKGTYVQTDSGNQGYISKTSLPNGTHVICSVSKVHDDGFMFLNLDSVRYPKVA